MDTLKQVVSDLAQKAKNAESPAAALNYSQAALNVAHAADVSKVPDEPKKD
jgi:hypothetical protein